MTVYDWIPLFALWVLFSSSSVSTLTLLIPSDLLNLLTFVILFCYSFPSELDTWFLFSVLFESARLQLPPHSFSRWPVSVWSSLLPALLHLQTLFLPWTRSCWSFYIFRAGTSCILIFFMSSFVALWSQNVFWMTFSLTCRCLLCSPIYGHFLWLFLGQQKEDDVFVSSYRIWQVTVFPSYLLAAETFLTVMSSHAPFSSTECCPLAGLLLFSLDSTLLDIEIDIFIFVLFRFSGGTLLFSFVFFSPQSFWITLP